MAKTSATVADLVGTYLAAQSKLGGETALVTNFRTTAAILDWVNRVFGALMVAEPGTQPAYQPLAAFRTEPAGGPAMTVLGAAPRPGANAETLREAEAADVAAVIARALAEGWTVADETTGA